MTRHKFVDSLSSSVAGAAGELGLWKVADVAAFLSMSPQWVYKAAEVGALPCIRLGAALRFHPADVRAYLDRLRKPSRVVRLPALTQNE